MASEAAGLMASGDGLRGRPQAADPISSLSSVPTHSGGGRGRQCKD